MNKAVTEGWALVPPRFEQGLTVWSRGDGTPGTNTYDGDADAALVLADADFADCLELLKSETTQRLRYMGQTPYAAGCYLKVTARVKAISGAFPTVRIATFAADSGGVAVPGVPLTGPEVTLSAYGSVVEVSAIIGSGSRTGVDLPWGLTPAYAHVGLDLTGPNGGILRVDGLIVEDVTSYFHRTMMDWVDVRDYGAVGDGATDDSPAFAAADLAAAGREILVPAGTYYLADTVTLNTPARFEGTVTLPADKRLELTRNFNLASYIEAFGDEVEGFRRALQALVNFTDHDSLDMGGRRVNLTGPIDVQAAVGNQTSFQVRRVLRNGQIDLQAGAAWDDVQVTSSASYAAQNPTRLTNVTNAANIPVGALVEGTGVGREVYVRAVNVGAQQVTLSQPLWGAPGSQTYTFTRFQYALDFSGFSVLDAFQLESVEIQCNGHGSGILLAPQGRLFHLRDCSVNKPKDRGLTSIGEGCQGLHIDRCQFKSDEQSVTATARTAIAFNVNNNDAKIRDNRFSRFRHTGVMGGAGHLIVGNHWFQGDSATNGARLAGLVLTSSNVKTAITGNYIDNASIEWTNEHDAAPEFSSEFSFGGLTITGNIFTANDVASFFNWITVKPYGPDHFIQGFSVTGNVFKSLNGDVSRVERIDDSIAPMDFGRFRRILLAGNTFNAVDYPVSNPATQRFSEASAQTVWTCPFGDLLPFGARTRRVTSVQPEGAILTATDASHWTAPYAEVGVGASNDEVHLTWSEPVKGTVTVTARIDNPN
ncbi:MAG: glycosyl hydrolase family 28-related protein [Pseudomonadota bacterium]